MKATAMALGSLLALNAELLEALQAAELYVIAADERCAAEHRAHGHGKHERASAIVLATVRAAIQKAERVA